jgi:hypothetical protein
MIKTTIMSSTLVLASALPEIIQFSIYEFASGDREYRRSKVLHQLAFARVLDQMYFRLMHKRAMEHNGIRLDAILTQMKVSGAIKSVEYPSSIPGQIYMNGCSNTPLFPTNRSAMEFSVDWGKGLDAKSIIVFRLDINRGSTFTMISYGASVSKSNTYRVHNGFTTLVADLISL